MKLEPRTVVWEYTLKCDSKCLHCGSNAAECRKNELSSEEARSLVEEVKDLGFRAVFLSGGEPTLRKDWFDVARAIQESGMRLGLISNALKWDNEMIRKVASLNMYSLGFSVDGEEETHDYLRGVDGSHRKVFDCIRELKKQGQTICAVTSVNRRNLSELVRIRNRLLVYGVDAWQLQMASPMGRMKHHLDLVLNEREYFELAKFTAETRIKLPHMNVVVGDCVGYYGDLEKALRDKEWGGCGAGLRGLGIRANGDVVGCLSMWKKGYVEGNIRTTNLRQIWENPNGFSYNRQFSVGDLKGQCVGCDYGEKCRGGCNSQSIAFFDEFNHAPYCLSRIEKRGLTPSQ